MKKIKTAAYCRVSTKKEEQDGSFELQKDYFAQLIRSNPDMEFAGIYGDKGKSGLYSAQRPGLKSLMNDCRNGRVELILVKSVSRFARNMSECSEMIKELRNIGVNIMFEKENLHSNEPKCDLLLHILSAVAQEESNSLSLHSVRSHEQYTSEGRPYGRISFGYSNAGDNSWKIDEDDAAKVKQAFLMAEKGNNYTEIIDKLNHMEINGYKWNQRRIKRILTNPVYKGDYYSHGTICILPGKQIENKGLRDRFYIKNHHDPIVSPAIFDRVQEIIGRKIILSYRSITEEDKKYLKGEI